ncbi:MAG TPA: thiamine diphosphokinase [Ktedonobacteraceae bacterium]|jgi:thiamine pyrophosphokinase|nr:thiamine diphosphokinase [Ktedonobacteraceae bacterium]
MHAVIFAGGTLRAGKAIEAAIASADLVLAADSGAATALHYGIHPAIVVGDFDSLGALPLQELQERGSQIIQAPVEKDETDTELAIDTAIEHGATSITLLGALGGARFDHTVANMMLLAAYENVPIRIVDGPMVCWLLRGPGSSAIEGNSGDLLSLIPLTGEAHGVRTNGLYYPLHGETLHFGRPRGVSNVLTAEKAEVSLEQGMLLIIHTNVQELED